MSTGANEAAFLGVQREGAIVAPVERKKSKKEEEFNDLRAVFAPAADKLIDILRTEIKNEDSNTYIRDRVRKSTANPTLEDYAVEERASEVVALKLMRIIGILEGSKRTRAK